MPLDGYWTFDVDKATVIELRRGRAWNATGQFKHYREVKSKRDRQLQDGMVFRNERDAAIALTQNLTAKGKKRIVELQKLAKATEGVIAKYDIGDCPYLVPEDCVW